MSVDYLIGIMVLVVIIYAICCMDKYVHEQNNPETRKARKELGEPEDY